MADLRLVSASDGNGEAVRATVTGIRNPSSTVINVDSVLNWPSYFIATSGTLLPDGTLDQGTVTVFSGHLSSTTIVIDGFLPGYSDTGNTVGQVVVLKPTTAWADEIARVLSTSLDNDGTLNNAALTQIASGLGKKSIRLSPRISVAASVATLSPNVDDYNYYRLTAQAAALTVANPTGTPVEGEGLLIELTDDGTSRAISWGANYTVNSIYGLTLPAATTAGKTHFITFVWSVDKSKYVAVL